MTGLPAFGDFRDLAPFVRVTAEKKEAYALMKAAIARGDLVRQPCEVCADERHVHAHHPDYAKPLDVMWLCAMHHFGWHRKHGPGLNGGDAPIVNPGGYDISGQRFGSLLVVRELKERRSNGGVLWYCVCDCGEAVARTCGHLRRQEKRGNWPTCSACRDAGLFPKPSQRDLRVQAFESGGALYSPSALAGIEDRIRFAFIEEFGSAHYTPTDLPPLVTAGFEEFMTGDGVVSDADAKDGETLQELGDEMGVTRERVRQIEARAMAKLRKAAKRLLAPPIRPRATCSIKAFILRPGSGKRRKAAA